MITLERRCGLPTDLGPKYSRHQVICVQPFPMHLLAVVADQNRDSLVQVRRMVLGEDRKPAGAANGKITGWLPAHISDFYCKETGQPAAVSNRLPPPSPVCHVAVGLVCHAHNLIMGHSAAVESRVPR